MIEGVVRKVVRVHRRNHGKRSERIRYLEPFLVEKQRLAARNRQLVEHNDIVGHKLLALIVESERHVGGFERGVHICIDNRDKAVRFSRKSLVAALGRILGAEILHLGIGSIHCANKLDAALNLRIQVVTQVVQIINLNIPKAPQIIISLCQRTHQQILVVVRRSDGSFGERIEERGNGFALDERTAQNVLHWNIDGVFVTTILSMENLMDIRLATLAPEDVLGFSVVRTRLDKIRLHFLNGTAIAQRRTLELSQRVGEIHAVVDLHATDTAKKHVPKHVPIGSIGVHRLQRGRYAALRGSGYALFVVVRRVLAHGIKNLCIGQIQTALFICQFRFCCHGISLQSEHGIEVECFPILAESFPILAEIFRLGVCILILASDGNGRERFFYCRKLVFHSGELLAKRFHFSPIMLFYFLLLFLGFLFLGGVSAFLFAGFLCFGLCRLGFVHTSTSIFATI